MSPSTETRSHQAATNVDNDHQHNVGHVVKSFDSPTPQPLDEDYKDTQRHGPGELMKKAFKGVDSIQEKILSQHAKDVQKSVAIRNSPGFHRHSRPFFAVISSLMQVISHTAVVLISNPMAPLTDPVNYFYSLFAYGLIYTGLFGFTCFLITLRVLHLDALIRYLSRKYAGGLSITAWANHNMFQDQKVTLDAARKILGGKLGGYKAPLETPIPLHFNREVARVILLMSAILYERDSDEVKKVFDYPEEAREHLLKSEERIYKFAADLGCKFISIADFQSASGPYAGAFYDIETGPVPFIIIVFKGTSPEALSEWIVDASCNLEASADRLGEGFAHQGFYSSLFPGSGPGDRIQPCPHLRILETIETIASEAYERTQKKTNLFIGGHSLGAGIASLLYARLLESPKDLGKHTILRDAYCFGTPRACGASLASRFEYNLSRPVNHHRALWRVINQSWFPMLPGDIVTRVPPGLADARSRRSALKEGSLLSYSAVGIPVILLPDGEGPFFKFGHIPAGYEVLACRGTKEDVKKPAALEGPIKIIDKIFGLLCPILHDHFPGCYFRSLNHISVDNYVEDIESL